MLFYRIENDLYRGCYLGCGGCGLNPSVDNSHPMPHDDSKLVESFTKDKLSVSEWYFGDYRFGFNSLEQLKAWFYDDKDLTFLHEKGFHLSIYDVPHVYTGNSQCLILGFYHEPKSIVETKALNKI